MTPSSPSIPEPDHKDRGRLLHRVTPMLTSRAQASIDDAVLPLGKQIVRICFGVLVRVLVCSDVLFHVLHAYVLLFALYRSIACCIPYVLFRYQMLC